MVCFFGGKLVASLRCKRCHFSAPSERKCAISSAPQRFDLSSARFAGASAGAITCALGALSYLPCLHCCCHLHAKCNRIIVLIRHGSPFLPSVSRVQLRCRGCMSLGKANRRKRRSAFKGFLVPVRSKRHIHGWVAGHRTIFVVLTPICRLGAP